MRPIERNVIEPLERATYESRRELEDALQTAVAVNISALLAKSELFLGSL